MRLSRHARLALAFAALVFLWGAATLWSFSSSKKPEASPSRSRADLPTESNDLPVAHRPTRPTIEVEPVFDPTDPRRLAGFSENVFTARVGRRVSAVPLKSTIPNDPGTPQVQFSVTVLNSLKASGKHPLKAGHEAVVDQMGGIDPHTGKTYVVATDVDGKSFVDHPLEAGNTYLFATRYDHIRGFHTIAAQPQGDVLLTNSPAARATIDLYRKAVADPVDPFSGGGGLSGGEQGPSGAGDAAAPGRQQGEQAAP